MHNDFLDVIVNSWITVFAIDDLSEVVFSKPNSGSESNIPLETSIISISVKILTIYRLCSGQR